MVFDYVKYESYSGGSKYFVANDIQTANGLFSLIYTLVFGGNLEASTTGYEKDREEREDYWGNGLFPNSPSEWVNSEFERSMRTVPLNSVGRVTLEQALLRDLRPLGEFGEVNASVTITGEDRINVGVWIEGVEVFNMDAATIVEVTDPKQPEILNGYDFSPLEEPFYFSGDNERYHFSEGVE